MDNTRRTFQQSILVKIFFVPLVFSPPWVRVPMTSRQVGLLLSGGVDSSVAAAICRFLCPTRRDLELLRQENVFPVCDAHWVRHTLMEALYANYVEFMQSDSKSSFLPRVTLKDLASNGRNDLNGGGGQCVVDPTDNDHDLRPVQFLPLHIRSWDSKCLNSDEDDGFGLCEAKLDEDERIARGIATYCCHFDYLRVMDLSLPYWHRCFQPLLQHILHNDGAVLNIDVLCNSEVKFGALLETIDENLDLIVSGHWARCCRNVETVRGKRYPYMMLNALSSSYHQARCRRSTNLIASPRDGKNDQTIFLGRLSPLQQLPKLVFPLGSLFHAKTEVREIATRLADIASQFHDKNAAEMWNIVANKKTSTGVCFVDPTSSRNKEGRSELAPTKKFQRFVVQTLEAEGHDCLTVSISERRKLRFLDVENPFESLSIPSADADRWWFLAYPQKFLKLFVCIGEKVVLQKKSGGICPFYVCRISITDDATGSVIDVSSKWNDAMLYSNRLVIRSLHHSVADNDHELTLFRGCTTKQSFWGVLRHLAPMIPIETIERSQDRVHITFQTKERAPGIGQAFSIFTETQRAGSFGLLASGWVSHTS